MKLIFVTGNADKIGRARLVAKKHGIELEQRNIDIDEIQSENHEEILRDKLRKAYEAVKEPVVVSDDAWSIPELNGFPGSYMKSVSHWLSVDDFLRLCEPLKERKAILHQGLAYTDGKTELIFGHDTEGKILREARGPKEYQSWVQIVVLDEGQGDLTIGEVRQRREDANTSFDENLDTGASTIWNELFNNLINVN